MSQQFTSDACKSALKTFPFCANQAIDPLGGRGVQAMKRSVMLVLCVIAFGLIVGCSKVDPTKAKAQAAKDKAENDNVTAITMAQNFVRGRLKSPSSASFPWSFKEYSVRQGSDGKWNVSGYVEAANSYNAIIKASWSVEMKQNGTNWALLSIHIGD
jgi:hypothetical protein